MNDGRTRVRRSTIYIACAVLVAVAVIGFAPREILKHKYRTLLSEKQGRLLSPDHEALDHAYVVATWRSVSFGWQTSYWCDMQAVVRPDASGTYTIPDVSDSVDVGRLWFSRLLGMEVDFSWDLFVYVPHYIPAAAPHTNANSEHAPWSLASIDASSARVNIRPIELQSVQSDPRQALAYYVSYLRSLDYCEPHETPESSKVRREAGKEAARILCAVENPAAVDKILASRILAGPVGLISLTDPKPVSTLDLRSFCESALGAQEKH